MKRKKQRFVTEVGEMLLGGMFSSRRRRRSDVVERSLLLIRAYTLEKNFSIKILNEQLLIETYH